MSNNINEIFKKMSQVLKEDTSQFDKILNHFNTSKKDILGKIDGIQQDENLNKNVSKIVENLSSEDIKNFENIYNNKDEIEQMYKEFLNNSSNNKKFN